MTVRITNESCIDTMSNMAEESVDLIITSPPYDSLRDYGGNTDFQIDKIVPPLMKVLKTGGVIV